MNTVTSQEALQKNKEKTRETSRLEIALVVLEKTYTGAIGLPVALSLIEESEILEERFQANLRTAITWHDKLDEEVCALCERLGEPGHKWRQRLIVSNGVTQDCQNFVKLAAALRPVDHDLATIAAALGEMCYGIYQQVYALVIQINAFSEARYGVSSDVIPIPTAESIFAKAA